MKTFNLNHLKITLEKKGAFEYSKVSYPIRYGCFHEIDTPDYIFQFNLNGEIKFLQGRKHNWPHPAEWLKRTVSNDWVYYSTGGYTGVYTALGEYYLPNLSYPSNTILGGDPFKEVEIGSGMTAWQGLLDNLKQLLAKKMPPDLESFLKSVTRNDARALRLRALQHQAIIEGRISVMPPDSRHVDYEVIPIIIADGCLYNCGFCRVKSSRDFSARSHQNILSQIETLESFYKKDLCNYNSIFLGLHDGLHANPDLILFAAEEAFSGLRLEKSHMKAPRLYIFGSAASLLRAEHRLFESINRLPYITTINIGLESADPETLALIKKPVTAQSVVEAFEKIIHINRTYANIEVTANFILSENLSQRHYDLMLELVREKFKHYYSKGAIYLSPFDVKDRIKALKKFYELKTLSRLPTYLYLIQRL